MKRKLPSTISKFLPPVIAIVIFLAVWQGVCMAGWVPSFMLPSPVQVVQALINEVNKQYEDLKGSNAQVKDYSSDGASSSGEEASTEAQGSNTKTNYGTATATDGVNIRSEASTNGAVLGTLYPGQEVNIVSSEGEWTHITFTDPSTGAEIEGYVSSSYLNIG